MYAQPPANPSPAAPLVAHRATVYYETDPGEPANCGHVRIQGPNHLTVCNVIDALSQAGTVAEVVSIWEDDGRLIVTRDGHRAADSRCAPPGAPGSEGNRSNRPADAAARLRGLTPPEPVVTAADLAAGDA